MLASSIPLKRISAFQDQNQDSRAFTWTLQVIVTSEAALTSFKMEIAKNCSFQGLILALYAQRFDQSMESNLPI